MTAAVDEFLGAVSVQLKLLEVTCSSSPCPPLPPAQLQQGHAGTSCENWRNGLHCFLSMLFSAEWDVFTPGR